jgi:senataxin
LFRKLRELPERLHWFCPRQSDEDREDYDNEILPTSPGVGESGRDIGKQKNIQAGQERKAIAINVLQLFALAEDNEEALNWLKQHLEMQLSRCDKCTMAYHRGKNFLMSSLRECVT